MSKRFPAEFKVDVVAVTRRRTVPLEEVAADFDISVSTLHRWMHQTDVDDGVKDGDELERAGEGVGEDGCAGLCKWQVWSTTPKKGRRGSGKVPGPAVHDDLVQRQFRASHPDAVWLTASRAPHGRGQDLLLLVQGPVLQRHRRLRHRAAHDRRVRHLGAALSHRPTPAARGR